MINEADACVYCGLNLKNKMLNSVLESKGDWIAITCDDSICCVKFRCGDDWQQTLEEMLGKKFEIMGESSHMDGSEDMITRCRSR